MIPSSYIYIETSSNITYNEHSIKLAESGNVHEQITSLPSHHYLSNNKNKNVSRGKQHGQNYICSIFDLERFITSIFVPSLDFCCEGINSTM